MRYQIGGIWVDEEQPGEHFEDVARHASPHWDLPLLPDDPEQDRKTPTVILDQEALLAMFREADQGCWNGEEEEQ